MLVKLRKYWPGEWRAKDEYIGAIIGIDEYNNASYRHHGKLVNTVCFVNILINSHVYGVRTYIKRDYVNKGVLDISMLGKEFFEDTHFLIARDAGFQSGKGMFKEDRVWRIEKV